MTRAVEPNALAAWLETRLTSDVAAGEWEVLVAGGVQRGLTRPLDVLLPKEALLTALEPHLAPERLADAARFAAREVAPRIAAEGHADEAPIGRWLSTPATDALLEFVARPGWIDDAWVHQLFREEAMEAIVSDTLYRALVDFSTLVPRIVQGVLPSGLGRLAKLGGKVSGAATGGMGGRLVEEVEKKLEAEIKRFLDKGTRKALEGAAAFCVERLESPETVQARQDLTRFALGRSGAFHARPFDPETLEALEGVAVAAATSVAASEELEPLVTRVVTRFYEARGAAPLRDWLAAAGVDPDALPVEAWARASWPAVRDAVGAPEVRDFLTRISGEILAEIQKG